MKIVYKKRNILFVACQSSWLDPPNIDYQVDKRVLPRMFKKALKEAI